MLKFKLNNGESLDIILHQENFRYLIEQEKTNCFSSIEVLSNKEYSNFIEISNFFAKNNIHLGETIISYDIVDQNNNVITSCYNVIFTSLSMATGLENKNVIKVEFLTTF